MDQWISDPLGTPRSAPSPQQLNLSTHTLGRLVLEFFTSASGGLRFARVDYVDHKLKSFYLTEPPPHTHTHNDKQCSSVHYAQTQKRLHWLTGSSSNCQAKSYEEDLGLCFASSGLHLLVQRVYSDSLAGFRTTTTLMKITFDVASCRRNSWAKKTPYNRTNALIC